MKYLFGDFVLDTRKLELRRAGDVTPVEPQVFALIKLLVENSERVVSKQDIVDAVWHGRIVSEAALSSRIKAARKALGDDGRMQSYIKTVHGIGFRFVADIIRSDEQDPSAGPQPGDVAEPARSQRARHEAATSETSRPSIAVLPFDNLSGDPQQGYFSDGITEDIITELARFSSLSVVARNTTFVYRDRAIDMIDAGRALGAQYLLEGSIRKANSNIRLTAQLIDADTGKHIWADRFDRVLEDIFDIQDELVHAIVAVLPGRIEVSQRKRALRKPASSMAAYDLYLKALELERQYDHASIVKGRSVLESAIALDPNFARAHALLAFFTFAAQWFENVNEEATLERAVELGHRAVELDPNDNDCVAKLGTAYLSKSDYDRARYYLEHAIRMNPHDVWTWSHYAWLLTTVGEHERSLEYMSRREAIDPLPPYWHWETRGISEYSTRQYRAAVSSFERIVGKGHWIHGFLASCFGQLGEPGKARIQWLKMHEKQPDLRLEDVFAANSNMMRRQQDVDHWLQGLRAAGLLD